MSGLVRLCDEVAEALLEGRAVVALETTLVAHGFPHPDGVEVALDSERAVREAGAVPATVGVLDGHVQVGLGEAELERFGRAGADARKLGARDLAACAVQRSLGATTVGGTLAVARHAGIRFMATGGLGGVHRGFPDPPDVSADLAELARTQALVVCAGVKSLLDVPATAELLETLGVPVLGWRCDTLPLFYEAAGGPSVSARADDAAEAARIALAHWGIGGAALLLGRPPDDEVAAEPLIAAALEAAGREGVRGQAVTPFVLAWLHRESGGATRRVNRALIGANAGLAGAVAVSATLAAGSENEEEIGR